MSAVSSPRTAGVQEDACQWRPMYMHFLAENLSGPLDIFRYEIQLGKGTLTIS